jgi:hypothetical protein
LVCDVHMAHRGRPPAEIWQLRHVGTARTARIQKPSTGTGDPCDCGNSTRYFGIGRGGE